MPQRQFTTPNRPLDIEKTNIEWFHHDQKNTFLATAQFLLVKSSLVSTPHDINTKQKNNFKRNLEHPNNFMPKFTRPYRTYAIDYYFFFSEENQPD